MNIHNNDCNSENLCKECVDRNRKIEMERIREQAEFAERQTVSAIVNENLRETERAVSLDESSILQQMEKTFCHPPDKTISQMTDSEVADHMNNLQKMISIIRVHVQATEREALENKKRDKKAIDAATKEYKIRNEPVTVTQQLNETEKVLWKISKQYAEDANNTESVQDVYLPLKKIYLEKGMKGVQQFIDENFD